MEKRQVIAERSHGSAALPEPFELPSWEISEERLLDAACEIIARGGTSALTIAELAREAGVSRPTIYRRWAGTDEVVRAALLRRTVQIIARLERIATSRDEIVVDVLRFSDLFRADAVFARLLLREPEAFTQYSLERIGSSQRIILRWLATAITHAQAGGTVRPGNSSDMAVMVLLIAQSALLTRRAVSTLIGDAEERIELTHALNGYLRA